MGVDWDELNDKIERSIDFENFFDEFLQTPKKTKKSGENKKYYCCFHDDDPSGRPNLDVNIKKGLYTCRSCQSSGNIWTFVKESPAVRLGGDKPMLWLADHLGIDVPQSTAPSLPYDPQMINELEENNELAAALLEVDPKTVEKFQVRMLTDEGDKYWVWPVWNGDDTVYAWRIMGENMGQKYFSSDENVDGEKQTDVVYPLHIIRHYDNDTLWVAEGEKDCLRLWDNNIPAISPLCGVNSCHDEMVTWIDHKGYDKVVIAFDHQPDSNEVEEARARFRNKIPDGVDVHKVSWPNDYADGHDVSDEILENGLDSLQKLVTPYPKERASEELPKGEKWTEKESTRLIERNGRLCRRTNNGNGEGGESFKPISRFAIRPLKKLKRTDKDKSDILKFQTIGLQGQKEIVEVPFKEMDTASKFREHLNRSWQHWQASSQDTRELRIHLDEEAPETKIGLDRYGYWPEYSIFCTPHGIYEDGEFVQDSGFEPMDTGSGWDRAFYKPEEPSDELIEMVGNEIYSVHKPSFICQGLGFFAAAWFRKWFWEKNIHFPFMNAHGVSGAGKTSILKLLCRLHGYKGWQMCDAQTTPWAIIKSLSSSSGPVLMIDEMKEDLKERTVDFWQQKLRKIHDGAVESRGQKDLSTTEFELCSPVAIAGEMPMIIDKSMKDRSVDVHLDGTFLSSEKGDEARRSFKKLHGAPINKIGHAFLKFASKLLSEQKIGNIWSSAQQIMEPKAGRDERKVRNARQAIFGSIIWRMFCDEIGMRCPDQFEEVQKDIQENKFSEGYNEMLDRRKNELDTFIEELATMARVGELEQNTDFYEGSGHSDVKKLKFSLPSCYKKWLDWTREMRAFKSKPPKGRIKDMLDHEQQRDTYVLSSGKTARWGDKTCWSVVLDYDLMQSAGLKVAGFTSEEDEDQEPQSLGADDGGPSGQSEIPF